MTVTEFEKFGVKKRDYYGLELYDITPETKPFTYATLAVYEDWKLAQPGVVSFDRHEKSYRFNDEVVISVWATDPPFWVERAVNDGYYRNEIPVEKPDFILMSQQALQRLWFNEEDPNALRQAYDWCMTMAYELELKLKGFTTLKPSLRKALSVDGVYRRQI